MNGKFITTEPISTNNVKNIYEQIINQKAYQDGSSLYFPCTDRIKGTITDMDHFPYSREFRYQIFSQNPAVWAREAGWRPTYNNCYNPKVKSFFAPEPKFCFQAPCSTVFPCTPEYLQIHGEKPEFDIALPKNCNVHNYG